MNDFQRQVLYEEKRKSIWLTMVLTFLLCGTGHMYLGKVKTGLFYMFGCLLLIYPLFFPAVILWVVAMVKSYRLCKSYNIELMRNLSQS